MQRVRRVARRGALAGAPAHASRRPRRGRMVRRHTSSDTTARTTTGGCRRAREFHGKAPGNVAALAERHSSIVDVLLAEHTAFIHGEFYAANILVGQRRRAPWSFGRWTGKWRRSDRRSSISRACSPGDGPTRSGLTWRTCTSPSDAGTGGAVPPRAHYLKTLDCCLIHLSVRNLGWSRDWSPPPDRSHDWLHEAMRLCDKWQL